MPRTTPANHGQPWTPKDDQRLRDLARRNTPTHQIAKQLGRTESSVRTHASEEEISLKPNDRRGK